MSLLKRFLTITLYYSYSLLVLLAALSILMIPAIWNGAPIIFYDSVDYLISAIKLKPLIYRPGSYYLLLYLSSANLNFLFPLIIQAIFTVYIFNLSFRISGVAINSKQRFIYSLLILSLLSPIAIFNSLLMPCFSTSLLSIALVLLALYWEELKKVERANLSILIIIFTQIHHSHLLLLVAQTFALSIFLLFFKRRNFVQQMITYLFCFIFSFFLFSGHNKVKFNTTEVSPRWGSFFFARLEQSLLVTRYLNEVCDRVPYQACQEYRDYLPREGWLLHSPKSPRTISKGIYEIENRIISKNFVKDYPWVFIENSFKNFLKIISTFEFNSLATNYKFLDKNGHIRPLKKSISDLDFELFKNSRQGLNNFPHNKFKNYFLWITIFVFITTIVMLLSFWNKLPIKLKLFCALLIVCLLINCVVCATVAEVYGRYFLRVLPLLSWSLILILNQISTIYSTKTQSDL